MLWSWLDGVSGYQAAFETGAVWERTDFGSGIRHTKHAVSIENLENSQATHHSMQQCPWASSQLSCIYWTIDFLLDKVRLSLVPNVRHVHQSSFGHSIFDIITCWPITIISTIWHGWHSRSVLVGHGGELLVYSSGSDRRCQVHITQILFLRCRRAFERENYLPARICEYR